MASEFVGSGIAFPMRIAPSGGVALVSQEREIEEAIRLILGTSPGERPMRPEFGSRISEHVFGPANAATAGQLAYEVRVALERWEPRIDVEDVEVGFDAADAGCCISMWSTGSGGPTIRGTWCSRSTSSRSTSRSRRPYRHRWRSPRPGRGTAEMALPTPDLDDRDFQSLVDEAKRLVQKSSPEWTDHNVSDPGVTLIEAFAQMVDQLIYRLNRLPDRHYVKFLELIGLTLYPPTAARGTVTFWLSAPQSSPVLVRAETEVATSRTDVDEPISFTTTPTCRWCRASSPGWPPPDRPSRRWTGARNCPPGNRFRSSRPAADR